MMNMFNPVSALSTLNVNQLASKISGVNKRVYYCQRCLNHGRLEPRKNHKCECAFINCQCNKCILVEKRRVLNTQLHELEDTAASAALVKLEEIPEQEDDLQADEMRLKGERVPNCQKCGQHGRKSRLKGHKRVCPFKDCNCPKCQVVSERQKLMADQIKIRRRQRKDTLMNLTREKITATLNAAAAVAAVPVPGFPQLSALYSAAATGSVNNHSAFSQPRASLPTSTLAHMGMSGLDMASFHGHDGRASPMSIHSLATVSSASPQTSTIMSPPSFNLIPSHASSPVLSSTSSTDLTPPHSAGLAAPIPINSMPMNTPISSNGGLLDNQQLLQLLLLCQQGPQQSAGLAQQPASLPQTTLPQPIVSTPTSPTNMIDMQEQLQKLLAMAAMNQTNLGHGAQPVQQLSPPPEDLKKFIGDNIEMVSDKHSSSEGGEDEEANDDVDVV